MIGSRFAVTVAHYDGLGANDAVERLRDLEQEAGCPTDLGWVSEAMFDPTFTLVTVARGERLRGYAAADRQGGQVRLRRLVAAPDSELRDDHLVAMLVDVVLRVAGHPPYRRVWVAPGFDGVHLLERVGWLADTDPLSGLTGSTSGRPLRRGPR